MRQAQNLAYRCLLAVSACGATACIGPPAGGPPAGGANTAAAPGGEAAEGKRMVVWDGDEVVGSAKGWADCDKKPDCKAELLPNPGVGHSGAGLKFTGEGPGWIGFGWNFFGWWPENSGIDITPYQHLVFWMKVEAESRELAPEPGSITVSLRCSSNKENGDSNSINVAEHVEGDLIDGKWHEIVVPTKGLAEGKQFDPRTTWEMGFGTWAGMPKKFTVYVDEIQFDSR